MDGTHPDIHLNVSVDLGIVEFILDVVIDGEGQGGPFGYMSTFIAHEDRIKKPRFADYAEFEEILKEGLKIYEDIKHALGLKKL